MRLAALHASLALSGLFAVSALAGDEEPRIDCENAMAQQEMNYCADKDYQAADMILNKTYRKVLKAMQAEDAEMAGTDKKLVGAVDALKRAQRAWISYRDGQCELAGFEARGGTMEPMLVSGCLADLTRKRTAELEGLLNSGEN